MEVVIIISSWSQSFRIYCDVLRVHLVIIIERRHHQMLMYVLVLHPEKDLAVERMEEEVSDDGSWSQDFEKVIITTFS